MIIVICYFFLLSKPNSICCGNGRCPLRLRFAVADFCTGTRALPRLPPYPASFQAILDHSTFAKHLRENAQTINNHFTFAGIGVNGSFNHFHDSSGPPTFTITGCTYHLLQDVAQPGHSMHWFLYDKQACVRNAQQFGINSTII